VLGTPQRVLGLKGFILWQSDSSTGSFVRAGGGGCSAVRHVLARLVGQVCWLGFVWPAEWPDSRPQSHLEKTSPEAPEVPKDLLFGKGSFNVAPVAPEQCYPSMCLLAKVASR
jgi:hypothetical protein